MFGNFLFENRAVYEIMCKNSVDPGRPQGQYGACALRAGHLTPRIRTQIM